MKRAILILLTLVAGACTATPRTFVASSAAPSTQPPLQAASAVVAPIPVFTGADAAEIPVTEELRTQIIPALRFAPMTSLRADLGPLLETDVELVIRATGQGAYEVAVTGPSAKVHRIVKIIAALEEAGNPNTYAATRKMLHASPKDAARVVNALFSGMSQISSPPSAFRVYAEADPANNSVVLIGNRNDVDVTLKALDKLDAEEGAQ